MSENAYSSSSPMFNFVAQSLVEVAQAPTELGALDDPGTDLDPVTPTEPEGDKEPDSGANPRASGIEPLFAGAIVGGCVTALLAVFVVLRRRA